MFYPSVNGFYLYKNTVIDIAFKDGKEAHGPICNITDTDISVSNYFNASVASAHHDTLNTLRYPISSIKCLSLIADRNLGWFRNLSARFYEFIPVQIAGPAWVKIGRVRVFKCDTTIYDVYPYLTDQGMDFLYEKEGKTFYFQGQLTDGCEKTVIIPKTKNGVWTNMWNGEVNGLAIGIAPETDSLLTIKGANIDIIGTNVFAFEGVFYMATFGRYFFHECAMKDTARYKKEIKNQEKITVKGFNISPGGNSSEMKIEGFSLVGLGLGAYETKGVSIAGAFNIVYSFKGVNIAGLRNASSVGRGLQIGLSNYCKDFKGIQIGLWNRNGKRTLPFINWR